METAQCDLDWFEHSEGLQSFRDTLISWGRAHFRPFPWRVTHDPYVILVAEVMLHRTQVFQVIPIFQAFINRYPSLPSLAQADHQELKKILSPLGLHWRIDLIHSMAQQIAGRFNLQIPQSKDDLRSLPGVSDYIASAVRCFAWNFPEPLIDTNTVRITGRVFGLETKDSSRRNTRFRKLITTLVEPGQARDFNYAMLDLAHLICLKKQEPICQQCPVLSFCCYGKNRINTSVG